MAQTGAIIRRNAGCSIPSGYLKLAIAANPTAWGVSVVTPEGLITNSGDTPPSVELFEGALEEYPDRDIQFFLCSSDTAINMEDVSPFWLAQAEDDPKIIGFVTGNIPGYKQTGSSHPSEYHFVEDYLAPKIRNIWEMLDGDIDKIFAQIEKPMFKKDVMNNVSAGAVTLVAHNGKSISWAVGDTASEYKWGWVSHNYGYAEGAPKAVEATKKASMFPSRSTVREKAPVSPGTAAADKSPSKPAYIVRKMKPRANDSRQEQKKFYQRFLGWLPVGWDKGVEIEIWVDSDTNQPLTASDIKQLGWDAVVLAALPPLNNPPRAGQKNVEPDHVQGNERPTGPAVTDLVLPVMSPKAREYIKDVMRRDDVKKLIASNGEPLTDPKDMKGNEIKLAGFGEQLGLKNMDDFERLPFSWYKEIAEKNAEAMANMCWAFKNMAIGSRQNKLTKAEEHTVAKEELKPQKPSMFPKKSAAA